ncbi:ricin-type beta-trefoil lectin domain protein [Kitasatospora sp. NPDC006786]|uniref:ricin-type beta-trefoil lectin domain protein n=1 Tax=unclassified Kitasatospora TaxID=2633591 RepID=UPI0033F2C073
MTDRRPSPERAARPRPARPRFSSLAALLALAVTLPGLTSPPAAADPAADPWKAAQEAVTAGDAKRAGELLDPRPAELAIIEAKKIGKDVPVPSLTDEFSTMVATPSGRLRQERHLDAQRVKRADGSWAALDDTLLKRTDGTLTPAAASEDLVISGGGSSTLATMTTRDGKQFAVGSPFPGPLPAPTVNGNSALYASVAPDTDLQVTATRFGGYSTVLILHTPAAAANPAVRSLTFPTSTKGVELSTNEDGSLKALSDGKEVFTAPKPQMWSAAPPASGLPPESTTPTPAPTSVKASLTTQVSAAVPTPTSTPTKGSGSGDARQSPNTPSTAGGPGTGATVADIPVTTGTGTNGSKSIVLSPSPELLDGPNTSYPIYVDPTWSNDARGKSHHAWVQSAYTTGNFDRTGATDRDRPGVGYQGWETTKGIERALYEFNLNGYLPDTAINYANLRVWQYVSADFSCTTTYPVSAYRAGAFDSSISWSTHHIFEFLEGKNVPGNGGNAACMAGVPVDFNVTSAMRNALADTSTPLAFAIRGPEGTGDKAAFKRFAYDAVLSTEFDHVPLQPGDPRALPAPRSVTRGEGDACGDGTVSSFRWMTDTTVNLTSVVSSHNQGILTEYVRLWDNAVGGSPEVSKGWSAYVPTGSRATYNVPRFTLQDGHYYSWAAQGDDSYLRGPETAACHFAVDTTPPVAAFGTFTDPNTQFPPSGNGQTTNLRLGQEGSIPFTAYDPNPSGLLASGVVCVRYGYDPQLTDYTQNCAPAGNTLNVTEIRTKPTHWGTNVLYAQVFDDAANASQTMSYSFYVPWAPGPVAFGDTTGDANPDILVPDSAGNLITHGRATDPGSTDVPPTGTAAPANQAPEAGRTWKDFHVTHRGSLDPGRNTDDLFVHRDGGNFLYYYANKESDPGRFTLNLKRVLDRPNCVGGDVSCPGYHQDEQWRYTTQITPIGSPKDTRTPNREVKDATGILAVEAGNLWYYAADSNHTLLPPNLVSTGGWDTLDLMVPGNTLAVDPAGTTPAAPALWARARTTTGNRTAGDILQYTLTTETRADGFGAYTTVTAVSPASAHRIGTDVTSGAFPTVGADGDVTGDGVPDLWALDSSGKLHTWPGSLTGKTVTGFGTDHYRGNTQAPTAQWKLQGNTTALSADPAIAYNTTATDLAFADDTVDGRGTKAAVFNGTTSAMTTDKPVVDTRKSFTISTWAKSNGSGQIVASQNTVHASSFLLWSEGTGGAWRFALARGDDNTWPYDFTKVSNSAALVQNGAWTRLTASYNADTGQMSLYVNGTLAGSGHHNAATSPAPSGGLVLGRYQYQGQPSGYFNGSVTNFGVYNTPVNPPTAAMAIRHAASNNCLDVPYNDTSQGLEITTCNNTAAQNLTVDSTNGTISLRGMCLDITGNNTANGAGIGLSPCTPGASSQVWLPRADGSLYNPATDHCLDLPNNDTTPGSRLAAFTCNGTPAQTWSFPALRTPPQPVNP